MEQFPRPIRSLLPARHGEPVLRDMVHQYLLIRRTCPDPGVAVCTVIGEVDLVTAPLLERATGDDVWDGLPALLVDLSQVAFLSLAGVRVLHGAAVRAAARGQWFGVVAVARLVRLVLELIDDVDGLIAIYRRLPDALRAAEHAAGASGQSVSTGVTRRVESGARPVPGSAASPAAGW
jgi:anti-sigma B factor antagonist